MGREQTINILYLSYDGLTDPLGRSQVLSYLTGLSSERVRISVVSFEKKARFHSFHQTVANECERAGIHWKPLFYTPSPPLFSTLYDLIRGWRAMKNIQRSSGVDIVHCRGYITAILGLRAKRKWRTKFIFDMRGFWPDEKKESGHWSSIIYGPVYRYFKRLETQFFGHADKVISLTEVGKQYIVEQGWSSEDQIAVIPTCINLDLFPPYSENVRRDVRSQLGIDEASTVFIYAGSIGGNYPIESFVGYLSKCHRSTEDSHTIILSSSNESTLSNHAAWQSYPYKADTTFLSVSIDQVHRYLMAANFGLIFYQEGFSNIGRSPTKMAEYLVSGVTPICGGDIGDVRKLLFGLSGYTDPVLNSDNDHMELRPLGHDILYGLAKEIYDLESALDTLRMIYINLSQK